MNKTGRPVLVGTTSVEQSDALSEQLDETEIPHEVSLSSSSCNLLKWNNLALIVNFNWLSSLHLFPFK